MYKILFVLVGFIYFTATAQVMTPTWGVSSTEITITKTTDFGTVHDYIELFNNSGGDLEMRWVLKIPPSWPVEWDATYTDPSNHHPDVLIVDSSDFLIPDPIGFENKLIIGVNHYSNAGMSALQFKVFPVDFPEDSLWLTYNIIINQGAAYAAGSEFQKPITLIASETNFTFNHQANQVKVFNLAGQLVWEKEVIEKGEILLYSSFGKGIFIVRFEDQFGRQYSQKIYSK